MPRPPTDSPFEQAARRIRRDFHDALPVNPPGGGRVRGYRRLTLFRKHLPAGVAVVVVVGINGQVLPFPRAVLDSMRQADGQGFIHLSDLAAITKLGCDTVVAILAARPNCLWKWH